MAKASKKGETTKKNYNWEESFAAPMSEVVPTDMGGMRLDQALARLFPQYSRNRLQVWLESGHITIEGAGALRRDHAGAGGGTNLVRPPQLPSGAPPQAPRMG